MHIKINSEFTMEDEVQGQPQFWGVLELKRAQAGRECGLGWVVEPLTHGSPKITPQSTKQNLPWMDKYEMSG